MSIIERARELRKRIEENAATMEDEQALETPELFPQWSGESVAYTAGNRVRYNGILYKALQSHESQDAWTPEAAPSLWTKVLIVDSSDTPEWEQPVSTNGYMIGDRVLFEGSAHESVIDNNVWSPADYPAGWQLVSA